MNKIFWPVLLVCIVGMGAIILTLRHSTPRAASPENTAPAARPRVAIDLYPLYASTTWQQAAAEEVTIGTTTLAGASVTSAPIDVGMDPSSVITPFDTYYDKLLEERGWHVVNDLAAGGHTGGQTGYTNGAGTILTRFTIDYKDQPADAPSECPCTVTLSLFSSGARD